MISLGSLGLISRVLIMLRFVKQVFLSTQLCAVADGIESEHFAEGAFRLLHSGEWQHDLRLR